MPRYLNWRGGPGPVTGSGNRFPGRERRIDAPKRRQRTICGLEWRFESYSEYRVI